jgi:hypothetical protein
VLTPVVPEEFNLAAFLLDRNLSEGRAKKPAVYCEQQTITYADLAEDANRVGNALLDLGVELENRVMICLARRVAKCKDISYGNEERNNYSQSGSDENKRKDTCVLES